MGKKGGILSAVGAVVGGFFGGPPGAQLGASIGGAIGGGMDQKDKAKKDEKQAKSAAVQAQKNADAAAKQADEDFNRANQKRPDTNAILAAAQDSVRGGTSGTMLTGAQGVDPETLKLGKTTLLGG